MPRSIFLDQDGQFLTNLRAMVQKGLDELVPYRVISEQEAQNKFITVPVIEAAQNVLPNRSGQTNEIARSRIKKGTKTIPIKRFSTHMPISIADLQDGLLSDTEVKTNLEIGLIKNAISSILFGSPEMEMQGLATLTGRTTIEVAKITTGKDLFNAVKEARKTARQNGAAVDKVFELLLPLELEDFLQDDFNDFQGTSIEDALRTKLKVVPILVKDLSKMLLFQPDEEVLFIPLFPQIFFRKIGLIEGDELQGHMRSTGLLHLNPAEVVEISQKP